MALDGVVLRALTHELQACVGSRINKIHQPNEHEIVLQIRLQGETKRLLLSANPTYPRIHWTNENYDNPVEAPMFCMLFRKHFEGALIEAIHQQELDRVLYIDVRHYDELGDIKLKRIVIELMGRHSNIILLDPAANTIYDGIHHITPSISSFRVVMPGCVYVSPPVQQKQNLILFNADNWVQLLQGYVQAESEQPLAAYFVEQLAGVSPLLAQAIAHNANVESLSAMSLALRNHAYTPNIHTLENGKSVFSVISLAHLEGSEVTFSTTHECLATFFKDKAERDAVKQRASDLIRFLSNEKAKNEKKQVKLQASLETSKNADHYRIQGELLTTYMHQIQKGEKIVHLINYYDENQHELAIELDPQLTPSENAQQYFKKYTKFKNSVVVIGEQLMQTAQEMEYISRLQQQVEMASLSDIAGIREELEEQGYLRRKKQPGKKTNKPNKPTPAHYVSEEGISIYVGKNNLQNEFVTHKLASNNDTWLHAKDMPGSHVIIKSNQFNDDTLEQAAQLAAYFSSGKQSSSVPIDYTLVRHVKKPSGAKPGYVIYEQQKTIFITPDTEKIVGMKLFK
jgi:predicted ribosome quality control (RQC) complex YloA/Tae2 family protein